MNENKVLMNVTYYPGNEEIYAVVQDLSYKGSIYADRSYILTVEGINFHCNCARKCTKEKEGYIEFDEDDDLLKLILKDLNILKRDFKIDEDNITYFIQSKYRMSKKVKKLKLDGRWIDKNFKSIYLTNKELGEKNKIIKSSIDLPPVSG